MGEEYFYDWGGRTKRQGIALNLILIQSVITLFQEET